MATGEPVPSPLTQNPSCAARRSLSAGQWRPLLGGRWTACHATGIIARPVALECLR
jgi:hypothetical protein